MFLPSSGICAAAAAGGQRIKKYIAEFFFRLMIRL